MIWSKLNLFTLDIFTTISIIHLLPPTDIIWTQCTTTTDQFTSTIYAMKYSPIKPPWRRTCSTHTPKEGVNGPCMSSCQPNRTNHSIRFRNKKKWHWQQFSSLRQVTIIQLIQLNETDVYVIKEILYGFIENLFIWKKKKLLLRQTFHVTFKNVIISEED